MAAANRKWKIAGLIVFTITCLGIFVYLFTAAGGRLRLDAPYTVRALVPESFNIVLNSDVRRDGIKIGRVRDVEPRGGLAEVKFEIEDDSQVPLYKDAGVRVRTKTLVGESYLDVEPGTPRAGELDDGDVLPAQQSAEAVPLERILDTFDDRTRRQVQRNMRAVGLGLEGKGDEVNELFGAMEPLAADGGRLMRVLEPQRRQLAALIGQAGTVMEALGERRADAQRLVGAAKRTAEAVAARDEALRATFRALPGTLAQAQGSVARLADFAGPATPVVRDLRRAAPPLTAALDDLEPAARVLRVAFRELPPALDALDLLVAALGPGAADLRTVLGPLDHTLREALPAVTYLRPYNREIASFFSNVPAALNRTDRLGNIGRVFGIAGAEQYTTTTPELKALLEAFYSVPVIRDLLDPRYNAYPQPGTIGREVELDGWEYPFLTKLPARRPR